MVGISGLSVVVISCHLRAVVLSVCQCEFVTPPPLLTLSINAEDSYCIASAADILLLKKIPNLSLVLVFQQIEFSSAHTMSTSWRDSAPLSSPTSFVAPLRSSSRSLSTQPSSLNRAAKITCLLVCPSTLTGRHISVRANSL